MVKGPSVGGPRILALLAVVEGISLIRPELALPPPLLFACRASYIFTGLMVAREVMLVRGLETADGVEAGLVAGLTPFAIDLIPPGGAQVRLVGLLLAYLCWRLVSISFKVQPAGSKVSEPVS